VNTPDVKACIVIILPYYAGTNATRLQGIQQYRDWAEGVRSRHPDRVVTEDWAPVAQAHPEYLDTDGFHLNTVYTDPAEDLIAAADGRVNYVPPEAATAYLDTYERGIDACRTLLEAA
jgi:hypothetical protein